MSHTINSEICEGHAVCRAVCPAECITRTTDEINGKGTLFSRIDPARCTDCGACLASCPIEGAILPQWRPGLQKEFQK